jgi:NADH-quinone oxidoreductase subunit J
MPKGDFPLFYTFHFYLFGIIAVVSALLFVTRKSPVAAALWLVNTMFCLAALYVMLEAHFIGVIQVLVYAGAIMVLFLFVVMLLNVGQEDAAEYDQSHPFNRPFVRRFGALLGIVFVAELAWAVWHVSTRQPAAIAAAAPGSVSSVREIGRVLFTDYAFPFEATSLLILVALVGAVVLARQDAE